jgi:hypothetical protein
MYSVGTGMYRPVVGIAMSKCKAAILKALKRLRAPALLITFEALAYYKRNPKALALLKIKLIALKRNLFA